MPQEINMSRDIALWKDPNGLTEDERRMVRRNLGFFVTADSLAANNIVLGTYRHISAPECRQYLLRQAFEEAIHTHAYQYIVESLGLTKARCSTPTTRFRASGTGRVPHPLHRYAHRSDLPHGTAENDQQLLLSLIVFACLMEGLFFYVGFTQILALGRQNKMTGSAEQYQYILRDESMHCNFASISSTRSRWRTPALDGRVPRRGAGPDQEGSRARIPLCRGHDAPGRARPERPMFKEYLRYIANRRAQQIGIEPLFPGEQPVPVDERNDRLEKKERNFFETRVIE